jgi:hypothetical protein
VGVEQFFELTHALVVWLHSYPDGGLFLPCEAKNLIEGLSVQGKSHFFLPDRGQSAAGLLNSLFKGEEGELPNPVGASADLAPEAREERPSWFRPRGVPPLGGEGDQACRVGPDSLSDDLFTGPGHGGEGHAAIVHLRNKTGEIRFRRKGDLQVDEGKFFLLQERSEGSLVRLPARVRLG